MKHAEKVKSVTIAALAASAALLLAISALQLIADPSRSPTLRQSSYATPDEFNVVLNMASQIAGPVEAHVGSGTPLGYVGEEERFNFFQTVLAPRRLVKGNAPGSPYILYYFDNPVSPEEQAALMHNTTLVVKLFPYGGILRKERGQ